MIIGCPESDCGCVLCGDGGCGRSRTVSAIASNGASSSHHATCACASCACGPLKNSSMTSSTSVDGGTSEGKLTSSCPDSGQGWGHVDSPSC